MSLVGGLSQSPETTQAVRSSAASRLRGSPTAHKSALVKHGEGGLANGRMNEKGLVWPSGVLMLSHSLCCRKHSRWCVVARAEGKSGGGGGRRGLIGEDASGIVMKKEGRIMTCLICSMLESTSWFEAVTNFSCMGT
jgi:hypothetical protein